MKQVGSWFFMCLIAVALLAVAIGIADMTGAPCPRLVQTGQAAAGGVLAQYYDANGNAVYTDEPASDEVDYYDEPCYDTSSAEPTYDDTYYYDNSPYSYDYYDTYDNTGYPVGYSGVEWNTAAPSVTNFVQQIVPGAQSANTSAGNPTLTETVVPIGVPTPPLQYPQASAQAPRVTVISPPAVSSIVSPVVISQPVQVYGQAYLPPLYQAPACYISTGASQVSAGDAVSVAWYSTGATSAYLLGMGSVGTAGSYQFVPAGSQTYTLNVFGPGGASTCSAYVSVVARPAPAAPAPQTPAAPGCAISADPASIFGGGTTTLTWSSSHATNISLSGIGAVSAKGSRDVSPASTQRYTLTATGNGGTRSCSVTVEVKSATSCTITCNGVTYACAPVTTPVSAVCPQVAPAAPASSSGGAFDSFWQWLTGIF